MQVGRVSRGLKLYKGALRGVRMGSQGQREVLRCYDCCCDDVRGDDGGGNEDAQQSANGGYGSGNVMSDEATAT